MNSYGVDAERNIQSVTWGDTTRLGSKASVFQFLSLPKIGKLDEILDRT